MNQKTLFETDAPPKPAKQRASEVKGAQRSLAHLRKAGYVAEVVEQWKPFGSPTAIADRLDAIVEERNRLVQFLVALVGRARPIGDGGDGWGLTITDAERDALADTTRHQAAPKADRGNVGYRKDLFGCLDIIAFRPGEPGVVGVQSTSRAGIAGHVRDYLVKPELREFLADWLSTPDRTFVLHGWQKWEHQNKSGDGVHYRWDVEERIITPADLVEERF